ncbi:hypothetical protein MUP77_04930 [Candidatus Bathyarchaeota archaeon]|nr:hypothetical protein [Candidatus Bathyarchaeota archaeon]
MGRPWSMVSGGVSIILVALFYLMASVGVLALMEVPMLAIAGLGVFLLAVASIKNQEPIAGEMEASITAGWGTLLLAIGAVGDLSVRGLPISILLIILALVFGILMIFAALRMWPKRAAVQGKMSSG